MLDSLFGFAKDIGKNLFTKDADASTNIRKHIEANNPGVQSLDVQYEDGVVTMSGRAESQAAMEKAVLMAGNVENVTRVVADQVAIPAPQSEEAQEPEVLYYVIESGNTLSGLAKRFYGDATKYPKIFEANREVIEDPDKIYPGQKIRIPALDGSAPAPGKLF